MAWVTQALGVTAILGGVTILGSSFVVQAAAERIGAGEPYCLEVASGRREPGPARSLADLGVWAMRAPKLYGHGPATMRVQWWHHAVLVRGEASRRLFNWSWRRLRFEPIPRGSWDSLHRPAPTCRPRPHFAQHLPPVG